MSGKAILAALAIVVIAQAGCEEKGISPRSGGPCPFWAFTPQPIVLNASSPVAASGISFRTDPPAEILEFALSDAYLIRSGAYNELLVTLRNAVQCPCDGIVAIYNYPAQRWDTIEAGFSGNTIPGAVRRHYVSALGLNPTDYVDSQHRLRIAASNPSMFAATVTAVQLNPEYDYFPVFPGGAVRRVQGISYDMYDVMHRNSLWVLASPGIIRFSMQGEELGTIETSLENLTGLAFHGGLLYLTESCSSRPVCNRVHIVNMGGTGYCANSIRSDDALSLRGPVFVESCPNKGPYALMLRADDRQSLKARLAPVSMHCPQGDTADVSDSINETMEIPRPVTALVYRLGTEDFLGASGESLYLIPNALSFCSHITGTNECFEPVPFPVSGVRGIAWDGSALWVLNYGPRELGAGIEPVVSKFYLR